MSEILVDKFIFDSPTSDDESHKSTCLEYYGWCHKGEISEGLDSGATYSFECISKQWFDQHLDELPEEGWSSFSDFIAYHRKTRVARINVTYESGEQRMLDEIKLGGIADRWVVISLQVTDDYPSSSTKAKALVHSSLQDTGMHYFLNQIAEAEGAIIHLEASNNCAKIIREASPFELDETFSGIKLIERVTVYDVGQGNAIGIFGSDININAIYFDFGAGVYANVSTYPGGRPAIPCGKDSVIVLSHWHEDHWAGIRHQPSALMATWLLPHNPTRHVQSKLLAQVAHNEGRLFYCSGYDCLRSKSSFLLKRSNGSTLNDSGFAAIVRITNSEQNYCILLPGDCAYKKLDKTLLAGSAINAVVATHHGGDLRCDVIPNPANPTVAKVIFSAGPKNSYGHPLTATLKEYIRKRWPRSGFQCTAHRYRGAANDITLD